MSGKIFARILVAMMFFGWIGAYIYGHQKYEVNYIGDDTICGTVGTMKTYEQMVSGKRGGHIVSGVTAHVDFGSKYGAFIMGIPNSVAFQGEGSQHCVQVREIDDSVRVPNGWGFFLFISKALFFSVIFVVVCLIICGIFIEAFTGEKKKK